MHPAIIVLLVTLAVVAILFIMCLRAPRACDYCSAIEGYAHHPGCQKPPVAGFTPKPTPCTCPERPDVFCEACGR